MNGDKIKIPLCRENVNRDKLYYNLKSFKLLIIINNYSILFLLVLDYNFQNFSISYFNFLKYDDYKKYIEERNTYFLKISVERLRAFKIIFIICSIPNSYGTHF